MGTRMKTITAALALAGAATANAASSEGEWSLGQMVEDFIRLFTHASGEGTTADNATNSEEGAIFSLIQGDMDEDTDFRAQTFMESQNTRQWGCGNFVQFLSSSGCSKDECPVSLWANTDMGLGKVAFAGVDAYALFEVKGLELNWWWCPEDDDFRCAFSIDAGGAGTYFDFDSPSTTIGEDGNEVTEAAGVFMCAERGAAD